MSEKKATRRKSNTPRRASHSSMWSSAAQQDDKSEFGGVNELEFLEEEVLLNELEPISAPDNDAKEVESEAADYEWVVYDGSADLEDQEVDTSKLVEVYLDELKQEQANGNWEKPDIPKRFSRRKSSGASERIKKVLADQNAKAEKEEKKRLSKARKAKAKQDALPKRVVEISNPGVQLEIEVTERSDLMDMVNAAFAKPTFAKRKSSKSGKKSNKS